VLLQPLCHVLAGIARLAIGREHDDAWAKVLVKESCKLDAVGMVRTAMLVIALIESDFMKQ
jgi:hypothetical protein